MSPMPRALVLLPCLALACGPEADIDDCDGAPCVRTVFVSEARLPGDLGGIAGADRICADEAAAAGLDGTYLAWLSDTAHSPRDRLSRPDGAFTLPDDTEVAASWSTLVTGLSARIAMHADGTPVPDDDPPVPVWTATYDAGQRDDINDTTYCGDWSRDTTDESVLIGWVHNRLDPIDWTSANVVSCASLAHIYCFQR
jgi:hypothetical protein